MNIDIHEIELFLQGKKELPSKLLYELARNEKREIEKNKEKGRDTKMENNKTQEKHKNIKRFLKLLSSPTTSLVTTLLVGYFSIYIPLTENNKILEKNQASKFYPLIVKKNESSVPEGETCNSPTSKAEEPKTIEKNSIDIWEICINNSSDMPIYGVSIYVEYDQNINLNINSIEAFAELPLISDPKKISILYPNSPIKVFDTNLKMTSKNSNDSTMQEIKSETKNMNFIYSFTDNSGINWKGSYRMENLDNPENIKLSINEELRKVE